jgi:hypothetical protein
MGDSYLKSGESIILTTHHISVNAVISEMMLTNQRLILVDTSYARFRPQTISFASIMKVMSGLTPTGEPIITLYLIPLDDPEGPETIDLIFSQQPGERRKRECDEWVKKLMGNIVAVRQKAIRTGTISADQDAGIQPSTRRWIAPEKLSPHTTVIKPRPVLTEVALTIPEREVTQKPEEETRSPVETREEVPTVIGSPADQNVTPEPPVPFIPAGQEDEEFVVPFKKPAATHDTVSREEPETEGSLTVQENQTTPAQALVFTSPEVEEASSAPEIPEELPDTVIPETPEIRWPLISTEKDLPSRITAHPAAGEPEPPKPPSSDAASHFRRKTAVAVIAVVIVLMVICGGWFLLSLSMTGEIHKPDIPKVTPTPFIQQTTTPVPAGIPATGDWVRVIYPREYIGQVGNPELLQPVHGTGDHFYKILNSDAIIQALIQKQDNFGDMLIVEVYTHGKLIGRRTVTAPMGTVEILLDARTGNPPGSVPAVTSSSTQNGSRNSTNMYY